MKCPHCQRVMNKGGWRLVYPNNPEMPVCEAVIWRCAYCWERGRVVIVAEQVKQRAAPAPEGG